MSNGPVDKEKLVFVLGDSRTGTLSINNYLNILGFRSIHYYVTEANQKDPAYDYFEENWIDLKKFIELSDYDAFSDYPTRIYYEKLHKEYPDAYFLLTYRDSIERWTKSMVKFFGKFNIDIDLDQAKKNYLTINNDIKEYFSSRGNFLGICIDEDNQVNSRKIRNFLQIDSRAQIGWENRAESYNIEKFSERFSLFNPTSQSYLEYIENLCQNTQAMLSEYGWIYLINDTNKFMHHLFGYISWKGEEETMAKEVFQRRHTYFEEKNIEYFKFIVPEKAAIYNEYLPRVFKGKKINTNRPAAILGNSTAIEYVFYPEDYLKDLKSTGLIYFRGDSHVNWLGGYYLYLYIITKINERIALPRVAPFMLSELHPSLAGYDGDLFVQLKDSDKKLLGGVWREIQQKNIFELLVKYTIPKNIAAIEKQGVPDVYQAMFGERETFVFENNNKDLPKCVIFRDSTADNLVELLAHHFSRSIFIWHKGDVYSEVIERERPDIVLHIMAERFVSSYPSKLAYVA